MSGRLTAVTFIYKGEAEHDIMYGKCIIVEGNGSGRLTERRIWFPRFPFSMMSHLIHLSPSVSLMRPWNIIVQPSNRFSHCYWPINANTEGARVESGCLSNERVSGILIWVRQTSWIVMGERRCDVSKDSLSLLYLPWRVCFQVPNVFIAPCSRPKLHQTLLFSGDTRQPLSLLWTGIYKACGILYLSALDRLEHWTDKKGLIHSSSHIWGYTMP